MARKSDYLSFAYRINQTGGLAGPKILQAMYDSARTGEPLPEGLDVSWQWQNAPEQAWHEDDFSDVVTGPSRGGFMALMLRRIQRDANRFGVTLTDTELEGATEEQTELFEEELEATREGRLEREAGRRKTAREQEAATTAKRSAAGKKAAATRKRNQELAARKAAALHRKRSAAAKKGWETRRRNERRKRSKRSKRRKGNR